jgi:hypothetical protein
MRDWGREERNAELGTSNFETEEGSGFEGEGVGSDICDAI